MYDYSQIDFIKKSVGSDRIGWIASCWDLLHPGHVLVLKDAKRQCDILVAGLHTDPAVDRPYKNKPVLTLEERCIMIGAIKFVDHVVQYDDEQDHFEILKHLSPAVRVFGDDYILENNYTGKDLNIPVHIHKRRPGWSTSALRIRVWEKENCRSHKE